MAPNFSCANKGLLDRKWHPRAVALTLRLPFIGWETLERVLWFFPDLKFTVWLLAAVVGDVQRCLYCSVWGLGRKALWVGARARARAPVTVPLMVAMDLCACMAGYTAMGQAATLWNKFNLQYICTPDVSSSVFSLGFLVLGFWVSQSVRFASKLQSSPG